jgi:hypothetical protein
MRNPDGTLNGDLNDSVPALISGSVVRYDLSSLDENQTTYDLLPVVVNKPPTIVASITETSIPQIKPYATADASGNNMYMFPDDSVKVNLGSTLTFKLQAEQPNTFNVENGIPKILPSTAGLIYVWKKDGRILTSYALDSLRSRMIVDSNSLTFENIQPEHAGSYTCEVGNDVGTSVSEPINLEVLNLDFDSFFYKNLVQNPYGKDGTDGWESTSSDLISKPLSTTPSQEFLKPYNVDLFGYTSDMLHPRPYQIDTGVEKGFDMTKDLLKDGSYFTRTRYTFTKKGGSFLVRAYQDIDLTDIEWLIRGGVWGVNGVRAVFSCYIGNGLGSFIPVESIVDPTRRTNPQSYVSNKPRISIENFLNSGPNFGPKDYVYVTLEEYDNETRLPSKVLQPDGSIQTKTDRIVMYDPWKKRLSKYSNRQYYSSDTYYIGDLSKGDDRDAVLFTADELMPDIERRYTYGQYAEFNKVVLERLNPNTTKIRITLHFETEDERLFETWVPTLDITDEPFEFLGYQMPFVRHSFNQVPSEWRNGVYYRIQNLQRNKDKSTLEYTPLGLDPRGMITGLNLMLLPILTGREDVTNYYTDITLTRNDTPESIIPSGLYPGRSYDPFGRNTRRLNLSFGFNINPQPTLDNSGLITQDGDMTLSFSVFEPTTQATSHAPVNENTLFPFSINSPINIEGATLPLTKRYENNDWVGVIGDPEETSNFYNYYTKKYVEPGPSRVVSTDSTASLFGAASNLNEYSYVVDYNNRDRLSEPSQDIPSHWNGKARYELFFANVGTQNANSPTRRSTRLQAYILTIDFSSGSAQTKVALSRTDSLYPGYGDVEMYLSHSIDSRGVFHAKIPMSLIGRAEISGGFGYVPQRKQQDNLTSSTPSVITVTGSLIDCVNGLRANLNRYVLDGSPMGNTYYRQVFDNILGPLTADINIIAQQESVLYYRYEIRQGIGGISNRERFVSRTNPVTGLGLSSQGIQDVQPVGRGDLPPQLRGLNVFYAWIDVNGSYRETATAPTVESVDFGPDKIVTIALPPLVNAGGFNIAELIAFRDALMISTLNPGYVFGSQFASINNYYTSSLSIDINNNVFKNYWANNDYNPAELQVPPHLQDIVNAGLTAGERPSLMAVKVVTPEAFNDGVGSPSSGVDLSGLDYSITYKVIKDSYTKDTYNYGP